MGEENFFFDLFIKEHGWFDGGGGGGANCGRRKNGVDGLLLFLFVVKSFTDVQRWMNVDDDIFSLFFLVVVVVCSEENRTNISSTKPHHNKYHTCINSDHFQIHVLHSIEYEKRGEEEKKPESIRSLFEGEINRRQREREMNEKEIIK